MSRHAQISVYVKVLIFGNYNVSLQEAISKTVLFRPVLFNSLCKALYEN